MGGGPSLFLRCPVLAGVLRPIVSLLLISILVSGCAAPSSDGGDVGGGGAGLRYALDCGVAPGMGNASWREPCLALASPNDSPSKTEIDVAVNPTDPLNVVVASKDNDRAASDCVWAVAQVSRDGGRTWKTSYVGGTHEERRPGEPLYGWRCITDPIMVFDKDGTLYYSLQASRQEATKAVGDVLDQTPVGGLAPAVGGGFMFMARSRDGGETWDKVITLLPGDGAAVFHDYMRMAWNPKTGSVYTIWNQFSGNVIVPVLVASRDGGESADEPVYPTLGRHQGSIVHRGLAVHADGTAWIAITGGGSILVQRSTDDARTWSAPVKAVDFEPVPRTMGNNTYRTGPGIDLSVDASGGPRDGWLYLTYADHQDEDANVRVQVSRDGGETWSEPRLVNDGVHLPGEQWLARPHVDAHGTLHLVSFDKSRDAERNVLIDATWSYSMDGGETWTHRRLTEVGFDGALGIHQFGGPFIGDYNGIASAGDVLYMGFPTTHTGRAEIAVAKVVAQDAHAAGE